jgi:hypothetical protein
MNVNRDMRAQGSTKLSPEDTAIIEKLVSGGLRSLYAAASHEPLPDRMNELLERLKAREDLACQRKTATDIPPK